MLLTNIWNNNFMDLTGSIHWPLLYRFVQTRCVNCIFLHLPEYGYQTRRFPQHRRLC